nr:alpha/beta hydrolase [Gordonia sp. SID5947]
MHLDLVMPAQSDAVPVIVFVHGGGWFTGDRRLCPDLREHFCARGFAMASVDYRLTGDALFPAQLHDVRAAIRHLRANAAELGLDPTRIGIWGASAGGHLAALVGLLSAVAQLPGEESADGDAGVQAVAESYGPATLVEGDVDPGVPLPGVESAAETPEGRLIGGDPAELPVAARDASPLYSVTSDAPPFQISHGTGDLMVGHRHSELLYDALARAGVEVDLYLVDGYRHGFLNPPNRSDVPMPPAMDNGRLSSEGPAPARHLSARGTERTEARTRFGFDDIGDFFARHLAISHDLTTTTISGDNR